MMAERAKEEKPPYRPCKMYDATRVWLEGTIIRPDKLLKKGEYKIPIYVPEDTEWVAPGETDWDYWKGKNGYDGKPYTVRLYGWYLVSEKFYTDPTNCKSFFDSATE
jgi:hypothetical protein